MKHYENMSKEELSNLLNEYDDSILYIVQNMKDTDNALSEITEQIAAASEQLDATAEIIKNINAEISRLGVIR